MKNCSGIGCQKPAIARGLCGKHWRRWRIHGDPEKLLHKTVCETPGCDQKHAAKGLCSRHFNRLRRDARYFANKERTTKYRYRSCLRYAKQRGLIWDIEFLDYEKLIQNNCHYCAGPLPVTRVGLDRKDNDRGYHLDNVVPCCRYCNQMKSDIFEYEEFLGFSKTDIFKVVLDRLHHRRATGGA